jgi:primosomal replication protein N
MTFKEFLLQADQGELVKLASALKGSFESHVTRAVLPLMQKLAEESSEQVAQQVTEQVTQNIKAYTAGQQANEIDKLKAQANVNDMVLPETGRTISKNDLNEALEEAILANNPKALAQVISGVLQAGGEESASNAISLARTILQDALVSGKLDKEKIQNLAQAFSVFEAE